MFWVLIKPRNDDSMDNDEDIEQIATPPKTPMAESKISSGRVTKPRVSPRKRAKKDYLKLNNPFVQMEDLKDENGEDIFDHEDVASEDSCPTDVEFGQGRSHIKSEHEFDAAM